MARTVTQRLVAVVSGGGSVLGVALDRDPLIKAQLVSVVADRDCRALNRVEAHGIPWRRIDEPDNERFSDALLAHCLEVGADYLALFFGRLLVGQILSRYESRIVNTHPSLLPAFSGLRALAQARRAGVRFTGTTVHFIDEHVDRGQVILQSVLPVDPGADPAALAHAVFLQMAKGFIQTCHWMEEGRLRVGDGHVKVEGGRYDDLEFSPALEAASARGLSVPQPVQAQ